MINFLELLHLCRVPRNDVNLSGIFYGTDAAALLGGVRMSLFDTRYTRILSGSVCPYLYYRTKQYSCHIHIRRKIVDICKYIIRMPLPFKLPD